MSYANYGTLIIIPQPAYPPPRDFTLTVHDSVGQCESPFTKQMQVQYWQGADWREIEVTYPPMQESDARNWIAWQAALRGIMNVFRMGDPMRPTPRGYQSSSFYISGAFSPGTYYIAFRGMTPGTGALLPGDYVQIGSHMYMIVQQVNPDSSGNATSVEISPCMRDILLDGIPVTVNGPVEYWRLTNNARAWSVTETKLYGFSFKATEVR